MDRGALVIEDLRPVKKIGQYNMYQLLAKIQKNPDLVLKFLKSVYKEAYKKEK